MLASLSLRQTLGIVSLLAFVAFLFALFSQHVLGMAPCAWCILQRLIVLAIAIIAGLGWWLHGRRPAVAAWAAALSGLLAIGGALAAWYQHTVAANAFSCDLSFADAVVTTSRLDLVLPQVFGIYATCADSATNLLGVRYEIWTLILFVVLAALAILALAPRGRREA
ncbi:MAG: disulfide bond formation protein B [Pigmentiphaga sp.]|nr:disulfide bond formation protein B [Pigmentiphaga sp.]